MSVQMITGASAASYILSQEPAFTTFNYTSSPAKNGRSLSVGSAYSSTPSSREQSPRPSFSATFEEDSQQGGSSAGYVSSRGARYHVYSRGRSPLPMHAMTVEYPENGATVVDDRGKVVMIRTPSAEAEKRAAMIAQDQDEEFSRGAAVYVKETRGRERQRERQYRC